MTIKIILLNLENQGKNQKFKNQRNLNYFYSIKSFNPTNFKKSPNFINKTPSIAFNPSCVWLIINVIYFSLSKLSPSEKVLCQCTKAPRESSLKLSITIFSPAASFFFDRKIYDVDSSEYLMKREILLQFTSALYLGRIDLICVIRMWWMGTWNTKVKLYKATYVL